MDPIPWIYNCFFLTCLKLWRISVIPESHDVCFPKTKQGNKRVFYIIGIGQMMTDFACAHDLSDLELFLSACFPSWLWCAEQSRWLIHKQREPCLLRSLRSSEAPSPRTCVSCLVFYLHTCCAFIFFTLHGLHPSYMKVETPKPVWHY